MIDFVLNMRRHHFIWLFGSVAAAWPSVAQTQLPAMMQPTQTVTSNLPKIEVVRVKRIDSADPRFQSRLSDDVVDLMKGFSLASFEGIGGAWKTPAAWPSVMQPQQPAMMQPTHAMTANLPKIEVVRVKRIDPAVPRFQSRLSDDVVDLMKGFSLASFEGIGGAWKTPPTNQTFDARFGRW